jgi:hypothetical protein
MASMPSKAQTMKLYANFVLSHSKTTPNTTSLGGVMTPCVKWTLMGLAIFVASHPNHFTALGLTNKCVVFEFKRHNTPLIPTLNLSRIKLRPNLPLQQTPLRPILFYLFTVLGKMPQLVVVETLDFGNTMVSSPLEFPCPWVGFHPTSFFGPSLGHLQPMLHFRCSPSW